MPTEQPKQDELIFKTFNQFKGMNTGEAPVAIAEDEMSILVNLMPIGNSTLKKIYPYSNDLAIVGNAPVKRLFTVNIGGVQCMVAFLTDGSAWKVDIVTWAVTQICPPGTLRDPKPAQWQTERMLVIDVNNYYDWDGTTWNVSDNGEVKTVTVSFGGSGYLIGDILNIIQTGGADATITVNSVSSGGVVDDISVRTSGRGYSVATGLATSYYSQGGGNGTGLTINITAIQSLGISGTSIAVFKNSVWIGNQRTVIFSAPGSFTDFTTESGGGSFLMNSPNLKEQVTGMIPVQDFLHVFGDHSCSIITGVILSSESPTSFSVVEIGTHIGLSDYDSMQVVNNSIVFSNDTGVYIMANTSQKRLHDELDGLIFNESFNNVGCSANIYGIECYGWLANVFNYFNDQYEKWIFFFFHRGEKRRLFAVNYGLDLNYVCAVEGVNRTELYGSYGNRIIRLFDLTASNPVTAWVRTRAEDFGVPIQDKQTMRFGMNVSEIGAQDLKFNVAIDADFPYADENFIVPAGTYIWLDYDKSEYVWQDAASNVYNWQAGGYPSDITMGRKFEGRGKKILIDVKETSSAVYTIQALYYEGITRARW